MLSSYVICGWYTPRYRHWWPALQASLEHHRQPFDFVEVEQPPGTWEAATLQKPVQIMDAMRRHPSEVVVFIDVDCVVRGDLSPLAELRGDVAMYLRGRRGRIAGYKLHARTGTVVLKPTRGARDFVATWCEMSDCCRYGEVDQLSFALAMGSCPDTTFQPLDERWCGIKGDPKAIILHDQASAGTRKVSSLSRWLHRSRPSGEVPEKDRSHLG